MGNIREETIEAINLMENYHDTLKGAIEVHFTDGHISPSFFRLSDSIGSAIGEVTPSFRPGMAFSNGQMIALRANIRGYWKEAKKKRNTLELNLLTEFGKAIKKASETIVRERGRRQVKEITIGYRRKKYKY